MKHKDKVFSCFRNFYAYVITQFKVLVQMLRLANGTKYINKKFCGFLYNHDILHRHHVQTLHLNLYHECPTIPLE
jgi:hypothetical protein